MLALLPTLSSPSFTRGQYPRDSTSSLEGKVLEKRVPGEGKPGMALGVVFQGTLDACHHVGKRSAWLVLCVWGQGRFKTAPLWPN